MVVAANPSENYESVGIMKFPTEWRKNMLQTTNQILYNISIPSDSQTGTIPQLLSYR